MQSLLREQAFFVAEYSYFLFQCCKNRLYWRAQVFNDTDVLFVEISPVELQPNLSVIQVIFAS